MKKVCTIVQEYYPKDIRIMKQTKELLKNGISISIICLRDRNQPAYEQKNGLHIYRLNIRKKRGSKLRYISEYFLFFISAFLKLNILDIQNDYDVIQINNLPDFLVFITIIQKLKGKKVILDMHEIMPEFFISKYKKSEKSLFIKVLKIVEKLSLNFADEIITVNDPIKEIFSKRDVPNKEITVVMNTVDCTVIPKFSKLKSDSFNLVYHGTLSKIYGLDIAIKSINIITKEYKDIKFYIFGDGPEREYLDYLITKYQIDKNVFLLGHKPYEVIIDYLSKMTVGILPIRKDVFLDLTFSNKLSEYIFLKIPVVISNLNAVQYYFSKDELTYFKAESIKDLCNKLYYAYNNLEAMNTKAKKAFDKYQKIKWSVMANRYLEKILR